VTSAAEVATKGAGHLSDAARRGAPELSLISIREVNSGLGAQSMTSGPDARDRRGLAGFGSLLLRTVRKAPYVPNRPEASCNLIKALSQRELGRLVVRRGRTLTVRNYVERWLATKQARPRTVLRFPEIAVRTLPGDLQECGDLGWRQRLHESLSDH
jgi:hypothetical protein